MCPAALAQSVNVGAIRMDKKEKEQIGLNLRDDMARAIHCINSEGWAVEAIEMNFEAWDLYCYTESSFNSGFWDMERHKFMGHEIKLGAELCSPAVYHDIPLFPTLEKMEEIESVPDVKVIGKVPDRFFNYDIGYASSPILYRYDFNTDTVIEEPLQDKIIDIKLRSD